MSQQNALLVALNALQAIDEDHPYPIAKHAIEQINKVLAQPEQGCAECGVKTSDGYALYCVKCTELFTQPEQEPFGYFQLDLRMDAWVQNRTAKKGVAFYPAPPSKPWVSLTDVEWMNIVNKNHAWYEYRSEEVAHEVFKLTEAALRSKNT
jgi:hypothetical protein